MSSPPSPGEAANTARSREPRKIVNQSPKDRIDNILESARARKIAMSDPHNPTQGLRGNDLAESSADEETSMVAARPGNTMNYQSTQDRVVRAQPSTTSIRRAGRVYEPGTQEGVVEEEHESWWARLISDYGSIELENKGSVARDHLALERTFLAWLRTSLAFASIGIAITQLFRLNVTTEGTGGGASYRRLRQMGKPLGATFLGISVVLLFVGFRRYFGGQYWIIRGKFPASRGSIALVTAITVALVVTSLVVVMVVEPNTFEL